MRILILIVSSDNLPVYKKEKELWRTYMTSHPEIDAYFIESRLDVSTTYIENQTIYTHGEESYEQLSPKTLDALQFCMSTHYDYIIRTNLSMVWDFNALYTYLQNCPNERFYAGQYGPYYNKQTLEYWFHFVGGMGIIMSKDVATLLLENREITESFPDVDDINIGYTMHCLGVPIQLIRFFYWDKCIDFVKSDSHFFYRMKQENSDRENEPILIQKLLSVLYPLQPVLEISKDTNDDYR
jgi:hypothetical protein